jgi:hypothetical protein
MEHSKKQKWPKSGDERCKSKTRKANSQTPQDQDEDCLIFVTSSSLTPFQNVTVFWQDKTKLHRKQKMGTEQ